MKVPLYVQRIEAIRGILVDLENQFKLNPFDEISYTIIPEKLINGTKLSEQKICSAVKGFLHAEQKPYSTRMSVHGRRRYTVTINKEEFDIWKEDVEKIEKGSNSINHLA